SGRDQLYDALFEQSGVIRAETIGDLFRTAKVFSAGLRLDGPRLAILTNSGGPGIVAADAAARNGLDVSPFTDAERTHLGSLLSPSAALTNPVDMTADAGPPQFQAVLQYILASEHVDGALVIMTPTGTMTAEAVAASVYQG